MSEREKFRQLERAIETFKGASLFEKEQAGLVALDLAKSCILELEDRLLGQEEILNDLSATTVATCTKLEQRLRAIEANRAAPLEAL